MAPRLALALVVLVLGALTLPGRDEILLITEWMARGLPMTILNLAVPFLVVAGDMLALRREQARSVGTRTD